MGIDPCSETEDDQPQPQQPSRQYSTSGHRLKEEEDDTDQPISAQQQSAPVLPPALTSSEDDDVTFSWFDNSEAPGTSGAQQSSSGVESRMPSLRRVNRQSRSAARQADMELDMVGMSRESTQVSRQLIDILGRIPASIDSLKATVTELRSQIVGASCDTCEAINADTGQMASSSDSGVRRMWPEPLRNIAHHRHKLCFSLGR
uniref:uncharacterized protein n=1 Tax=Pristiophorus japonicus TaxID=55135 RepID=UPI00398F117B